MEKIKPKQKTSKGRWTRAEHNKFMDALEKYGRNWDLVQKKIKTRTLLQVRSHAQKVFLNMSDNDIDAIIGFEQKITQQNPDIKLSSKSEDISSQKIHFKNFKNTNAVKIVENSSKNSQKSQKFNSTICIMKNQKYIQPNVQEEKEKNSVSQKIQKKEQIQIAETVLQVENLFKIPVSLNFPYHYQTGSPQIFFWNPYTFTL